MTLEIVCEKFDLDKQEIIYYCKHGALGKPDGDTYAINDEDISKIGTALTLSAAGLEKEKIVKLLSDCSCSNEEKIRFLRELRDKHLDEVHDHQKLLDKIDYIIYSLKNGK